MKGVTKHEVQARRRELSDSIPALAARLFEIKARPSLMKTLGSLMLRLNDYDNPFNHVDLLVCEVLHEELTTAVGGSEHGS